MYGKTRNQLPLGMIVVTLFVCIMLLVQWHFSMEHLFSNEIFPYMLGVGVAEVVGLIIFLKITLD